MERCHVTSGRMADFAASCVTSGTTFPGYPQRSSPQWIMYAAAVGSGAHMHTYQTAQVGNCDNDNNIENHNNNDSDKEEYYHRQ